MPRGVGQTQATGVNPNIKRLMAALDFAGE